MKRFQVIIDGSFVAGDYDYLDEAADHYMQLIRRDICADIIDIEDETNGEETEGIQS